MEFYPGQTYVGPSQTTQQGMQMAQQRALAGSPLLQGAQQTVGALQTATNPALGGFADVYGRAGSNPASGDDSANSTGRLSRSVTHFFGGCIPTSGSCGSG